MYKFKVKFPIVIKKYMYMSFIIDLYQIYS